MEIIESISNISNTTIGLLLVFSAFVVASIVGGDGESDRYNYTDQHDRNRRIYLVYCAVLIIIAIGN